MIINRLGIYTVDIEGRELLRDTQFTGLYLEFYFHSGRLDLCCLMCICSLLVLQANEILQNFLQSQATIEESIVQLDTALNRGAMAIAGTGEGLACGGMGRFLHGLLTYLTRRPSCSKEFSLVPQNTCSVQSNLKITRQVVVAHQPPGRAYIFTLRNLPAVWPFGEITNFPVTIAKSV